MDATQILVQSSIKCTPTRIAVLEQFLESDKAISHSELEDLFGEKYDRVTLYRTLKTFEDQGLVHKVYDENGTVRFNICSHKCSEEKHKDDHVHFHCIECDSSYCLDDVPVPQVEIPAYLKVHDTYMVVNGTCNQCLNASLTITTL